MRGMPTLKQGSAFTHSRIRSQFTMLYSQEAGVRRGRYISHHVAKLPLNFSDLSPKPSPDPSQLISLFSSRVALPITSPTRPGPCYQRLPYSVCPHLPFLGEGSESHYRLLQGAPYTQPLHCGKASSLGSFSPRTQSKYSEDIWGC